MDNNYGDKCEDHNIFFNCLQVNMTHNVTFTGNDRCPTGYFCPNGTSYPKPCPIGTFSEVRQVSQESDCQPCRPGRYCNQQAFTMITTAPNCSAGY